MNGKDLEKALLWEAPHIGGKSAGTDSGGAEFLRGIQDILK